MSTEDLSFMAAALALAHEGARHEEVPVGAVVVLNGEIVVAASISPLARMIRQRTPR